MGSVNDENNISSESLQDLSNLTPNENHNGKTVEEVLYELKGLESLPEDFIRLENVINALHNRNKQEICKLVMQSF